MTGTINIGTLSYGAGAAAYLLLTALLLTAWKGRLTGGLLVSAVALNGLWCVALAVYATYGVLPLSATLFIETLRGTAWLLFLLKLLGQTPRDARRRRVPAGFAFGGVLLFCAALAALDLVLGLSKGSFMAPGTRRTLVSFGHVLLAVVGLALVEQLYRNTRADRRWAIKLLCFGVGGLFVFDFYLYSNALLFKHLDPDTWMARGIVNAMIVPLLAVSAVRNPDWSLDVFVSRHVVFHSAALLGAGVYLIAMAAAGYYIRIYGGTWGSVGQSVFLFGALVLLVLLLFSGQLRSRVRVFLSKHFFRNKYDYREEWLRFTRALSSAAEDAALRESIVRAIADIMESQGGLLWMRGETGEFRLVTTYHATAPETCAEPADSSLVRFLERSGWVVYLDEYREQPERYESLVLPDWMDGIRRAWLLVPLMQGEELIGFVLLLRSETKTQLDWEDSDLLKTVGRQAGSYLALMRVTQALTDARQFEAFNRLSAYVVHDLKNLAAQLSLVVSNSRRHRDAPGFVDDALATVENATGKMNRLLAQLRKGHAEQGIARRIDLQKLLEEVVCARGGRPPAPQLEHEGAGAWVEADGDRLAAVVEHLVQNAQEATPADGTVTVGLACTGDHALVEVRDTGCGMDARFIAERLFRPFDTTKGNAGMGIGVYESREFVNALGGRMEVTSTPGEGTRFRVFLPLAGPDAGVAAADAVEKRLEMAR